MEKHPGAISILIIFPLESLEIKSPNASYTGITSIEDMQRVLNDLEDDNFLDPEQSQKIIAMLYIRGLPHSSFHIKFNHEYAIEH